MKSAFFTTNLWQKALALVLAFSIWGLAPSKKLEGQMESQFFIPLSYVNLPKELEMVSQPLQSISIAVTYEGRHAAEINPTLFQANLDLAGASEGKNVITIEKNQIKGPGEAKVVRINPSSVEIEFDKRMEKVLDINPVLVGEPSPGYVIQKVIMEPGQVLVHGPASKLKELSQLETKGINVDELNTTIEMVATVLYPPGIQPVPPVPEFYSARLQVGSMPMTKTIERVSIGLVNQSHVTRINPKTFNLQVKGPRSLVEGLEAKDVQAFIDLQNYKPGTYKLKEPTIRLHPDIETLKTWPPIDLWVRKQQIYE